MTVEDPKTFTRAWTMTTELLFDADTDLLEYVCNENEKSRQHFVREQTSELQVDPSRLAGYAGVYELMTPRGAARATVVLEDGQLMMTVPGRGTARLIPQSATTFLFLGAVITFVSNDKDEITHLTVRAVEGEFTGARVK